MSYSSRAFLEQREAEQAEAEGYIANNHSGMFGRRYEVVREQKIDYHGIPYEGFSVKPVGKTTAELWEEFEKRFKSIQ